MLLFCLFAALAAGGVSYAVYAKAQLPDIKDKTMFSYTHSFGGGMSGGGRSFELHYDCEDRLILTASSKSWYGQIPSVREYLVADDTLSRLEEVARKYHMERWNNKEFTNQFIADGASESYHFAFKKDRKKRGGYESFGFSSQYYPDRYANKLAQLDAIVSDAVEKGELLPGLLLPAEEEEDAFAGPVIPAGEVSILVTEYSQDTLHFRMLNGTESELTVQAACAVYDAATGDLVCDNSDSYSSPLSCSPQRYEDAATTLSVRLGAGIYRLTVGEYNGTFEIGDLHD
ncbi:MAG: hypothetical protein HUJ80_02515 [Firmicutes bacterium]|mgnify:FL=1|nr:hypothetical protein [Bacillota bacterium]